MLIPTPSCIADQDMSMEKTKSYVIWFPEPMYMEIISCSYDFLLLFDFYLNKEKMGLNIIRQLMH